MKFKAGIVVASCLCILGLFQPYTASAQVVQWNQTVVDRELRSAFYRALREVAVEYISDVDELGLAGTITFVDHQLDYPLQLTSSNFRHVTINAAQAKAAYLLRYQAKTTAGTQIPIGLGANSIGAANLPFGVASSANYSAGGAEIPGDGGMMLCPINRTGLEFMFGALAVATVSENGEFRTEEDGEAIVALHDAILRRTYELYGSTP